LNWSDLSKISSGKIHFFGNWQIPMVESKKHDLFINAASFGEMEPEVVQNYLKYIKPLRPEHLSPTSAQWKRTSPCYQGNHIQRL
jgi:putative sugar O-methyltransferase